MLLAFLAYLGHFCGPGAIVWSDDTIMSPKKTQLESFDESRMVDYQSAYTSTDAQSSETLYALTPAFFQIPCSYLPAITSARTLMKPCGVPPRLLSTPWQFWSVERYSGSELCKDQVLRTFILNLVHILLTIQLTQKSKVGRGVEDLTTRSLKYSGVTSLRRIPIYPTN